MPERDSHPPRGQNQIGVCLKILHVIPSLDPTRGGPVDAVLSLRKSLSKLGVEMHIVTLDSPSAEFLRPLGTSVTALGPSSMGIFAFSTRLIHWMRTHSKEYHNITIHGLWQFHGIATWLGTRGTKIPYLLFSHGMMDPWFRRRYPLKHLKKQAYWLLAERLVTRDAAGLLFTSEEERRQSINAFWPYKVNERVMAYSAQPAPTDQAQELRERFQAMHPECNGKHLLLFLGRIHEKKGCDLLIDCIGAGIRLDDNFHLVMAGPGPDSTVKALQQRARDLNIDQHVTWTGMLKGDDKWAAIFSASAFVLPSHQENFGIAVAEALSAGVPVLISDKVNIWREIKQHNAAIVEDDTLDGTKRLLEKWLELSPDDRAEMCIRAKECYDEHFTPARSVQQYLEIVQSI